MKYGEDQRQRLMNAMATASRASNKLQKRLKCLEFCFLNSSILIIMGNFKFGCVPMNAGSSLRVSCICLGK